MNKKLFLILSISFVLISCKDNTPLIEENKEPINENKEPYNGESSTFTSGGKVRKYILYKPTNFTVNSPLVFILHGDSLTNSIFYKKGFNAIAEKYGFLVCYPQSINKCWNYKTHDNEDVIFLKEIAQNLQKKYKLNASRTFSAGYSDGGSMCYLLALDANDIFKSIAVVAGSITDSVWQTKINNSKISILHIHGYDDKLVPYDGGGKEKYISIMEILYYFSNINNYDYYEADYINGRITQTIYTCSSSNNYYFNHFRSFGQGHVLPGDSIALANKTDISGINAFSLIGIHFNKIK